MNRIVPVFVCLIFGTAFVAIVVVACLNAALPEPDYLPYWPPPEPPVFPHVSAGDLIANPAKWEGQKVTLIGNLERTPYRRDMWSYQLAVDGVFCFCRGTPPADLQRGENISVVGEVETWLGKSPHLRVDAADSPRRVPFARR